MKLLTSTSKGVSEAASNDQQDPKDPMSHLYPPYKGYYPTLIKRSMFYCQIK